MILTGKAKEDFENWVYNNTEYLYCEVYDTPEKLLYSLIIDWFDSVGIYISITPSIPIGYEKPDCFMFSIGIGTNRLKISSRHEATKQAIIKANEIYNNKTI